MIQTSTLIWYTFKQSFYNQTSGLHSSNLNNTIYWFKTLKTCQPAAVNNWKNTDKGASHQYHLKCLRRKKLLQFLQILHRNRQRFYLNDTFIFLHSKLKASLAQNHREHQGLKHHYAQAVLFKLFIQEHKTYPSLIEREYYFDLHWSQTFIVQFC